MIRRSAVVCLGLLVHVPSVLHASGDAAPVVFKFSNTILMIPIAVTVLSFLLAWVLPRLGVPKRVRWLPFGVGVIAGAIVAPGMARDRVVVGPEAITQTMGFWFENATKGFVYEEVRSVRITRKPTGVKRRISTVWEVRNRDGSVTDIEPGDLWETNTGEIVPLLRGHGVVFEN